MNVEVLPDIPESPVSSSEVTPESRDSPLPEIPPALLALKVPIEELIKSIPEVSKIEEVVKSIPEASKLENLETITVTLDVPGCIPYIIGRVRKFVQNLRISLSTPRGKTL
jgi:hypothetical protein